MCCPNIEASYLMFRMRGVTYLCVPVPVPMWRRPMPLISENIMKKIKNKKLLRKPSRPGKTPPTVDIDYVGYSQEATVLINTLLRTVIRNVNNGLITVDDVAPISVLLPLLLMKHYYKQTTCENFCTMFRYNWPRTEPYIGPDYDKIEHFVVEQSKALTMNDEL